MPALKRQVASRQRLHAMQLSLQLELVYLAVFLALVLLQRESASPRALLEQALLDQPFPTAPNASTFSTYSRGFPGGAQEYFQWLNNVVYARIFLEGAAGAPSTAYQLGAGPAQPWLLFPPQLRVLRVLPVPCPVNPAAALCYPPMFSAPLQATASPYKNASWVASNAQRPYEGSMATYPSSGYMVALPLDARAAAAALLALQAGDFIDPAARFVCLTLSFYFANSGNVCSMRAGVEIDSSGLFLSSAQTYCAPMFSAPPAAAALQALQIAVAVLQAVFLLSILAGLYAAPRPESYVCLALDVLAACVMVTQSVLAFTWNDALRTSHIAGQPFWAGNPAYDFEVLQALYAATLLLVCWRLFRYSELFPYARTVREAGKRTAFNACTFFLTVLVICVVFALCGATVLGPMGSEWSTGFGTALQILSFLDGEIDYYAVWRSNPFGPYFAPMFLLPFLAVFLWYLHAVFMAVVYSAWRETIRARRLQERGQAKRRHEPLVCGELSRRALGLPARQGFLSDGAVLRCLDRLPPAHATFAQVRQALAAGGARGQPSPPPLQVLHHEVAYDALSEQTARLLSHAALLDKPDTAQPGAAAATGPAPPSLTVLRRLAASLHRLEASTNSAAALLAKQLSSVLAMLPSDSAAA